MKKKCTFLFALLLFFALCTYGQGETHNNIIVFDISGSMAGLPAGSGNVDIWTQSLELLEKQLNSFPENEKISLYLFGESLIQVGIYSTNEENNLTSKILSCVDSIKVNNLLQSYTCIYKSLDEIITKLDNKEINTIYLFTDGRNSNNHVACGDITMKDLKTKWENSTKENEYLYIYKLKTFDFPAGLDEGTVMVIDSPFIKQNVVIEPLSTIIRISRAKKSSSMKFRITGTGTDFLPPDLILLTNISELKSQSDIKERAYITPDTFSAIKSAQEFKIETYNAIENISPVIYYGSLSYSFSDNSTEKTISRNSINLTITIKNNMTKVIFNNLNEVPTVDIEFID